MAIYRGPGGAGDATNDATSQSILAAQSAQEAAASEAAAASSASSAATSATNAASSATAAASSATSAANSASSATTQAANAASSAATATTKAAEAVASETNAASSATAAATSATNASNSATASANSATSASNSASAASTSATNAATYASNAATSATNAAASETNAAASANSASTSATSAAASATSAGNSASSATTSATNAANSATAAATSASAASTSATNAANSATSASTSATNAANSATAAATSETNAASSASGAASSASSAAASAAAAAASLDSFDDRYLGSKTTDPTLDNDGNALVTGALYYNSVEGEMRVYDGFQWIAASAASQAILVVYKYTATAGQTTFTGTDDNALTLAYTVGSIIVTVNGVVQEVGTDVTASTGTSIVLAVAASTGDEVNIHAFSTFDVANTYTKAEADAKYLTITSPTIPSGTANGVAYINGSKVLTTGSALTFDGSNLGLGVTPSAWTGAKAFDFGPIGAVFADGATYNSQTGFASNAYRAASANWYYKTSAASAVYVQNLGTHAWYTAPSGTAGNAISFTQAMSLDSSGGLRVGTTSSQNYAASAETFSCYGSGNAATFKAAGNTYPVMVVTHTLTNSQTYLYFISGTNPTGSISTNGSTTTYATSSDYRLKDYVKPMQNALAVVEQLNPVTWKWKADSSSGQGFIAHELQAVVPDCVTGEKDAVDKDGKPVYQGIDTSFLVATLTKAIQEQQEQINQLKAEVAALKGTVQ